VAYAGAMGGACDCAHGCADGTLSVHRWTDLFFDVAHARSVMSVALQVVLSRGALPLSSAHIRFLIANGTLTHTHTHINNIQTDTLCHIGSQ
jgi:hypothetical protein